jgi:PAS domain S-box-containing protein
MSHGPYESGLENATLLAFLRAGTMPLTYVDRDGTVLHANDVGIRNTGAPRERVLGRSIYEVVPSMADRFRPRIEQVFTSRQPLIAEDEIPVPDGPRLFKSVLDPVFDASGEVIAVQCQSWDVTAEHHVADSLSRADHKLSVIFEHSPYLITMFSRGGTLSYINRVGPGFTMSQVVGSDGHAFVAPEHHDAYDRALSQVFDDGSPAKLEFRDVHGTWWEATLVPVTHHGRVETGLSFSVDITDRRRAAEEQARLQGQMQHAQKLESLGVLAGGIAHDFNNLLLVIMANTELAMRGDGSARSKEFLLDVMRASERATDLCKQMLAYAGRGQLAVERVDLSRLVAEMAQLVSVSVSKGVGLRRDLAADLPAIDADPTQLRQIVLNLLTNASDAIGEAQGTISITTRCEHLSGSDLISSHLSEGLAPGAYVTLEVRDTGSGIDEATRSRMFEPFFSTKGSGRGLGLSATLGVIRSHHGAVFVESAPGLGTSVRASFPASGGAAAPTRTQALGPAESGRGTILVVDDEDAVRRVASRALRDGGYDVVVARDGQECLALYEEHGARVRAVLLDLTMPVLDGDATLRALRERAPRLPVVIMSGYAESTPRGDDVRFLSKPFRMAELLQVVRAALGDDAPR